MKKFLCLALFALIGIVTIQADDFYFDDIEIDVGASPYDWQDMLVQMEEFFSVNKISVDAEVLEVELASYICFYET